MKGKPLTQADKNLICLLIDEIERAAHTMQAQTGNKMSAEEACALLKTYCPEGIQAIDDQNLATETGRDATEQAS